PPHTGRFGRRGRRPGTRPSGVPHAATATGPAVTRHSEATTLRDPQVKANIHAAGAVLWRQAPAGGIEIAVVHRPKYEDWSLPKGKLDPGETPVLTAVRETEEETGLRCRLGRYLGKVTYPIPGHRKLKRVD